VLRFTQITFSSTTYPAPQALEKGHLEIVSNQKDFPEFETVYGKGKINSHPTHRHLSRKRR
jgi:hypothetical protein